MKLCVVAGEASGDLHASEILRELRTLDPELVVFGIGGDLMERQGVRLLHHARELGIVGLFNVLRHLPMFRALFSEILGEIERQQPDAVLLVDYPDFNLRLARACHQRGFRVIYYISPQVWAWRRNRVHHIARYVDHMLVLFPFEEEFYREHSVPVTYVGHPLVEQLERRHSTVTEVEDGVPLRLALMPGSRRMEVQALLPPMLDAVRLLRLVRPVEAFILKAPTISRDFIESISAGSEGETLPLVEHDEGQRLSRAHVALSSSGTATLEAAVIGVPVVVMYHLSRGTYFLARRLVKLSNFGLVNIVAGKQIVPELIQQQVNGPRIVEAIQEIVQPSKYREIKEALAAVREKLGGPGASRRAAEKVYKLMTEPHPRDSVSSS
ncbi:MAG: lipid-A-disaccharide synthase [Acidobacteriota bacterium]